MPKTNSESDFGGSITSDEDNDVRVDAGPSSPITPTSQFAAQGERPTPRKVPGIQIPSYPHPSSKPVSPTKSPQSTRAHSSRMHTVVDMAGDSAGSTLRGAALFRATARKVLHMCRASLILGAVNGVGAEPGIDPRRSSAIATYGHIKEKCAIRVFDYNSVRSNEEMFENNEFVDYLKTNGTRPGWSKVRWISVGGISWDVISTIALQYDLHPLALEDVLHRRNHVPSKADYFPKHLFLRVLCHSLGDHDEVNEVEYEATRITNVPRSSSPDGFGDEKNPPVAAQAIVAKLKEGNSVNVQLQDLFVFLLRDGTVITIHQTPTPEFAMPILTRLRARETFLRKTADPSLLVQSLLDLVVDRATLVVEDYQKTILKLEHDVLLKPKMKSVRHLHILSGDLTRHKRTLGPLKSLVYGLRRYDLDRCKAIAASVAEDPAEADVASRKVVGYMSHKAKVYLADVHDHVDYILTSLDMFASISENLINYTFNMASYETTEVMRRLTMATIVFLPLTTLTGYFGMNFKPRMWSVVHNTDVLYWKIAIPVMVAVLTLFMWSDIVRAKHFAEKKMAVKRIPRTTE